METNSLILSVKKYLVINSINNNDIIISSIILIILLLLSAIFSASEVAFFSLPPIFIEEQKKSKKRNSKIILNLLKNNDFLLATILVSNNFVNIGFVILSTTISNKIFNLSDNPALKFIIEVAFITSIILLFGEIIPKIYATHHNKLIAKTFAPLIYILSKIFYPISLILIKVGQSFKKYTNRLNVSDLTIEKLSEALEIGVEGIEEEKDLLEGVVNLRNTEVSQIMTPRVDVVAIEYDTDFEELIKIIKETEYSRIPVFQENIDNVKGILYIKDILPYINLKRFQWQKLIRNPYFVPETKKIDELLREFQSKKIHMAIVVDEYGGTSGIVTLEDILEEIVGEITDETDDEEKEYIKINDNTYYFDGKILINDFCKVIGLDKEFFNDIIGEADTLAGLILEIRKKIPEKNEIIHYKNLTIQILKLENRRIKKVKVIIKK